MTISESTKMKKAAGEALEIDAMPRLMLMTGTPISPSDAPSARVAKGDEREISTTHAVDDKTADQAGNGGDDCGRCKGRPKRGDDHQHERGQIRTHAEK